MVKNAWGVMLLLAGLWPNILVAETHLTVQADKHLLVLGEPLTVVIRAQGDGELLDDINLTKLKHDFDVYAVSKSQQTETRNGREVKIEITTLTLYPLRVGHLQLPALNYSGTVSKPLSVSVVESSPQTSRVLIKAIVEPIRPRERQAAFLYLDIYDDGSLQWSSPGELNVSGIHVRQLAETQRQVTLEGTQYTVHRYAWAALPLRDGVFKVIFPMLDAHKFGTHLRYAVAPLGFNAQSVPAYLPVHVPIGRPNLSVEALPQEILLNRPVNWEMNVRGSGITEEGMAKLLSTIRSNDSIRIYPPAIRLLENQNAVSPEQMVHIAIPFQALRAGRLNLPQINIPYFDPVSERLEAIMIETPAVNVVNPLWQILRRLSAGAIVLVVMIGTGYTLWKKYRLLRRRNISICNIEKASTPDELGRALLAFEAKNGALVSATLQQWLHRMERIYGSNGRLSSIVQMLETAKYGSGPPEMSWNKLSKEAAKVLKGLKAKSIERQGVTS